MLYIFTTSRPRVTGCQTLMFSQRIKLERFIPRSIIGDKAKINHQESGVPARQQRLVGATMSILGTETSGRAKMEKQGEKKRLHFDKFMVGWLHLGEKKKHST